MNHETAQEASERLGREINANLTLNKCYLSEVSRFTKWVDRQAPNDDHLELPVPDPGGPKLYVSIPCFEYYATTDIVLRDCNSKSAKKALLAIASFSIIERTNVHGKTNLDMINILNTATVRPVWKTLDAAKQKESEKNQKDPHANVPTKVLQQESLSDILLAAISQINSWGDLAMTVSACSTTLIRHNSTLLLTLPKMIIIDHFPPNGIRIPHDGQDWNDVEEENVDKRMLGFIIPPSDQLKKQSTKWSDKKTEVVACFRNKQYERAYESIMAVAIFLKFHRVAIYERMTFKNVDDNDNDGDKVSWREMHLFGTQYQTMYRQIKSTMAKAEVPPTNHVTHFR